MLQSFQSDMYSQQQVLQAVITDGQTLVQDGDAEEQRQFQHKLQLLDSQWQSLVRRANQHKVIIYNQVALWNNYRHLLDRLRSKLDQVDSAIQAQQLQPSHIQQLRLLLESIKVTSINTHNH